MEIITVKSKQDEGLRMLTRVLRGYVQKSCGLLFAKPEEGPVLLVQCRSIHTFGMRYHIDVCFCNKAGVVLASHMNVPANRVLSCPEAWCVLEKASCLVGSWPKAGETLEFISYRLETKKGLM